MYKLLKSIILRIVLMTKMSWMDSSYTKRRSTWSSASSSLEDLYRLPAESVSVSDSSAEVGLATTLPGALHGLLRFLRNCDGLSAATLSPGGSSVYVDGDAFNSRGPWTTPVCDPNTNCWTFLEPVAVELDLPRTFWDDLLITWSLSLEIMESFPDVSLDDITGLFPYAALKRENDPGGECDSVGGFDSKIKRDWLCLEGFVSVNADRSWALRTAPLSCREVARSTSQMNPTSFNNFRRSGLNRDDWPFCKSL